MSGHRLTSEHTAASLHWIWYIDLAQSHSEQVLPCHLTERLAPELLIEVLKRLHWQDILRVRRLCLYFGRHSRILFLIAWVACQRLYEASKARPVWLDVFFWKLYYLNHAATYIIGTANANVHFPGTRIFDLTLENRSGGLGCRWRIPGSPAQYSHWGTC